MERLFEVVGRPSLVSDLVRIDTLGPRFGDPLTELIFPARQRLRNEGIDRRRAFRRVAR